jgi:hypothetical protein
MKPPEEAQDWSHVEDRWHLRATKVAARIPPGSSVIDLGAGAQGLRDLLPPGCTYTPADLHRRTEDTILFDADSDEWPDGRWDVAVMAGLLEHCADQEHVVGKVCGLADLVLCTYSHDGRFRLSENLSESQLVGMFERRGFSVSKFPLGYRRWWLYRCITS